ncbi:hypothetical protein BJX68DRAFT_261198 [Aspergillus pseudodeflectus]|uniref:Vacuolar ATPase assembly protein VMA22 n=1 Tax=Aspergillus pseudodeflectus TaxID=176178 RepID=A0ABR4L6Y5_9EURO
MAQLATPPASRQPSEAPDSDPATDLVRSLDTLLERYLELLDKHQKLQGELASRFSSGFLSLAQANYTCPPGRRYGADYYDERMKATKRVLLQPPPAGEQDYIIERGELPDTAASTKQIFSIVSPSNSDANEKSGLSDQNELPVPNNEPEAESKLPGVDNDTGCRNTVEDAKDLPGPVKPVAETDSKPNSQKKGSHASNPMRWFGILVPPSLRNAQKSFTEAIECKMPELASIVVEMQAAERKILRLREELGRQ